MRATCLDPTEFQLDGCADFGFFQAWDPLFVNQIFEPFPPVRNIYCIEGMHSNIHRERNPDKFQCQNYVDNLPPVAMGFFQWLTKCRCYQGSFRYFRTLKGMSR